MALGPVKADRLFAGVVQELETVAHVRGEW
jgi:hypothetical protein